MLATTYTTLLDMLHGDERPPPYRLCHVQDGGKLRNFLRLQQAGVSGLPPRFPRVILTLFADRSTAALLYSRAPIALPPTPGAAALCSVQDFYDPAQVHRGLQGLSLRAHVSPLCALLAAIHFLRQAQPSHPNLAISFRPQQWRLDEIESSGLSAQSSEDTIHRSNGNTKLVAASGGAKHRSRAVTDAEGELGRET